MRRSKGGTPSVHPIGGRELRALRRLRREGEPGRYVFVSERQAPLSVAGYQRMVARAGEAAGFPFLISRHVLHSCGYKLANDGRDTRSIQHYLGHRSIAQRRGTPGLLPIGSRISGRIEAGTAGAASLPKPKGVEGENILVPSNDCSLPPHTASSAEPPQQQQQGHPSGSYRLVRWEKHMKLFLVTTLICFEVALANAAERTIPPNTVSVQVSKIEPGKPCLAPACPEDWMHAVLVNAKINNGNRFDIYVHVECTVFDHGGKALGKGTDREEGTALEDFDIDNRIPAINAPPPRTGGDWARATSVRVAGVWLKDTASAQCRIEFMKPAED